MLWISRFGWYFPPFRGVRSAEQAEWQRFRIAMGNFSCRRL